MFALKARGTQRQSLLGRVASARGETRITQCALFRLLPSVNLFKSLPASARSRAILASTAEALARDVAHSSALRS